MRRRKRKDPPNFLNYREIGFGVWEIWYDSGAGSGAASVGRSYLVDSEAQQAARSLAERNPDRRYCVKLKR